jgi:hypothetical protein
MSNRDLLKEAIADAKAVKETAIANAKAALEEAFAPQLKSMLSAKLEEMDREEMEEEISEEVVTNEAKEEVEEGYEKDMDEAKAEELDEDINLDEVLAELEEGEDKEDVKEVEEMDETIDEAEEEEVEVDAEEEIEGEDDEEIDLEEMSEDDLKSFIEDVIADMVEAGELEAGEEFEAEDEEDSEEELDIEADEEVELTMEGEKEEVDEVEEGLGTINDPDGPTAHGNVEEGEEDMEEGYGKDDMDEGIVDKLKSMYNDEELLAKIVTVDGKKVSLKDLLGLAASGAAAGQARSGSGKTSSIGETEDMMEEVNALRAELHEVNLLNAKLLYSNKIFRANSLKEAQKVKVLEAFDKAETVSEVKLVFQTLSESVTAKKEVVKENLGSASRAAGVAQTVKAPIVDVDPQVARWQKLAGIK